MKGQNKKNKKELEMDTTSTSVVSILEPEMPTAEMVAEERAREAAYERELADLQRRYAEGGDSCSSSDGEASLRGELRALRPPAPPPRGPPSAAAVLPQLAAALRRRHDVRFLDEYMLLLEKRTEAEAQAATEELMRTVGDALSAEGAGDAVLASWLGAACAWAAPRVPGALPALYCLLQQLTQHQVREVAEALHAALGPRELLAVGDALRGERLAAALLRAALDKLLGRAPAWRDGAPTVAEVRAALAGRWEALDAEDRLAGLALVGRVMSSAEKKEATALLACLTPPSPRDSHDPDYLKVNVAVKRLRNLLKEM